MRAPPISTARCRQARLGCVASWVGSSSSRWRQDCEFRRAKGDPLQGGADQVLDRSPNPPNSVRISSELVLRVDDADLHLATVCHRTDLSQI